jgi:preprotein translocase subunit SecE
MGAIGLPAVSAGGVGDHGRQTRMTMPRLWDRSRRFLRETRVEFTKVTWPSRDELRDSTGVVILVSMLVAAFIGLVDLFFSRVVQFVLR